MGEGVSLSSAISAEVGGKTGAVARLEVDAAHRLATARGLLRRLEDRAAGAHPVVEPGADTRVLPVVAPLAALFPKRSREQLGITARSLFSAVHGMVALGLEQKLVAVPLPALRKEIAGLVRAMIDGLIARQQ